MKLYALHDKKAKALSAFQVQRNDTVASRSFAEACVEPKSHLGLYAEDFELVSLCDVSQEYEGQLPSEMVANVEFRVVITAEQVLAAQPKSEQLQLLKEA